MQKRNYLRYLYSTNIWLYESMNHAFHARSDGMAIHQYLSCIQLFITMHYTVFFFPLHFLRDVTKKRVRLYKVISFAGFFSIISILKAKVIQRLKTFKNLPTRSIKSGFPQFSSFRSSNEMMLYKLSMDSRPNLKSNLLFELLSVESSIIINILPKIFNHDLLILIYLYFIF